MNLFEMHNVVIPTQIRDELEKRGSGRAVTYTVNSTIKPVLEALVVEKPTWKFSVCSCALVSSTPSSVMGEVRAFTVHDGHDLLGQVTRDYGGRNYKILITNERIREERQRAKGYKTEKPERAIAFVRKNFRRNTVLEHAKSKYRAAEEFLADAVNRHSTKLAQTNRVYIEAAQSYVLADGFETFLKYAQEHKTDQRWARALSAYSESQMMKQELASIGAVRQAFGAGKSALVIRDIDKYIVRIGDNVQIYDDNDFPEELRGKLGMLKLVEKEQIVPDTGCRVSDDVFVVLLEEPNKVSEGE